MDPSRRSGRRTRRTTRQWNLAPIKKCASVEQVLAAHNLQTDRRGPCPIHGGDNKSAFSHNGTVWSCFTHCGSGDVIRLVMLLRGVGFLDAVWWLEGVVGRRAEENRPIEQDEFPDIAPYARAAWLASIDERWNTGRRVDPCSPFMDDIEEEWREARRMPGRDSIRPLLDAVVQILRKEA